MLHKILITKINTYPDYRRIPLVGRIIFIPEDFRLLHSWGWWPHLVMLDKNYIEPEPAGSTHRVSVKPAYMEIHLHG